MRIVPEAKRLVHVGQTFGKLTVIGTEFWTRSDKGKSERFVVVSCDCGNSKEIYAHSLTRSGGSRSCGCVKHVTTTHGQSVGGRTTRLYCIWSGMHARCRNKRAKDFARYGGRGISVSGEWSRFESFSEWAMANGYQEHLTIDRIDNDGGYNPNNCRWVTWKDQERNRSTNRHVAAFGETKLLCEWVEDERCRVSESTLYWRIANGWAAEKAIELMPLRSNQKKKE